MKDVIIKKQYQIIDLLREELICNTFLARILNTEKLAFIKQYRLADFPSEFHTALIEKVEAVRKLDHPTLLKILDFEFEPRNKDLFLVYEKVDGKLLSELVQERGFFSHEKVVDLLEKIKTGIDYLNEQNYFHGSLNMDNIYLSGDGSVKLSDYVVLNDINAYTLRATRGAIIDSAVFLSPEQINQGLASKSSDIYALGVVLYKIYSGNYPFRNICEVKKIAREMTRPIAIPKTEGELIPVYITNIIMMMLEHESADRFKTVGEVIASFNERTLLQEDGSGGEHILKQLKGEYISDMKKTKQQRWREKYRMPTFIALGLLFVFIAVYGLWQSYFSSIREVKIPELKNVYKEEAVIVLRSLGLNPQIEGEVEDDTIKENHVVSSIPEMGRVVKEGRLVRLFISKGQSELDMPNVTGLTEQEAFTTLKNLKLVPRVSEKIFSNTIPMGTVIMQEPAANTSVMPGSDVILKMSGGYPVELTVMEPAEPNAEKVSIKLKFSLLSGWSDSRVKVNITTHGATETVYDEIHRPGDVMLLEFEESPDSKVTVYYDGNTAFDGYVKDFQ